MRITKQTDPQSGNVIIEIDTEAAADSQGYECRPPTNQEYQIIRDLLDLGEMPEIEITLAPVSNCWSEETARANLEEMLPAFDFSSIRRKGD